ncbi:MAG: hypothetical protein DGJ47_000443 [Rickettsiaceae bacterium]
MTIDNVAAIETLGDDSEFNSDFEAGDCASGVNDFGKLTEPEIIDNSKKLGRFVGAMSVTAAVCATMLLANSLTACVVGPVFIMTVGRVFGEQLGSKAGEKLARYFYEE